MNKKIKFSLLGTLIVSSSLAMALPIVSCSTNSSEETPTKTLKVDLGNSATDATKAITSLFNAKKTFQEQEDLLAGWTTDAQLDASIITAIRKNIKFTDDTGAPVEYFYAVAEISFSKSFAPLLSGSPTSTAQLKIVFTKEYLSSVDVFIEIGSLGNLVASTIITSTLNNSAKDATDALKKVFDAKKTFYEQKDLIASWKIGKVVDQSVFEAIQKTMTFVDDGTKEPVSFVDAVDRVEISKPFNPLTPGVAPTGAELKVVLKTGYISSLETFIPISSLGLAKAMPLSFNADVTLKNKLEEVMTNALSAVLADTTDRISQDMVFKLIIKGDIKDMLTDSLNTVENFHFLEIKNNNIINWIDVISTIKNISAVIELPAAGEVIPGFSLKFNLNSIYSCSNDLTFNIGTLGIAK